MKCPYCEKETAANEKFCAHCGAYIGNLDENGQVKQAAPVQQPAQPQQQQAMKYCRACGALIPQSSFYCPKCNKIADTTPANTANAQSTQNNGMATAGFIVSFFSSLIGIILCIIGLNRAKTMGGKGKGMAIAGIIIGVVGWILNLFVSEFLFELLEDMMFLSQFLI